MSYTYILCSCNAHKEFKTASLICTFTENEEVKVIDYIKYNLDRFFDGHSKQERRKRFNEFFAKTNTHRNIADVINTELAIYALVQQIPNI